MHRTPVPSTEHLWSPHRPPFASIPHIRTRTSRGHHYHPILTHTSKSRCGAAPPLTQARVAVVGTAAVAAAEEPSHWPGAEGSSAQVSERLSGALRGLWGVLVVRWCGAVDSGEGAGARQRGGCGWVGARGCSKAACLAHFTGLTAVRARVCCCGAGCVLWAQRGTS